MNRKNIAGVFGLTLVAVVVFLCSAAVQGVQTEQTDVNYFAAAKQASAPGVAWMRSFESGSGGNLITDRAGDVYMWYETGARVLKYDSKGKVIWDKRFVPRGQNGWCNIASNPKGELFLSWQTKSQWPFSRLMPNGTLAHKIYLPRDKGLAAGSYAMDASGGWITIEHRRSKSDEINNQKSLLSGSGELTSKEYLAKYSPSGKLVWSTYLRDSKINLNYLHNASCNSMTLDTAVDMQGNSYLLQGDLKISQRESQSGLVNGKLNKFGPDGRQAWSIGVSSNSDTVDAMKLDSAGNIYIAGRYNGLGYYISKFNPDGKQVWIRAPKAKTGDVVDRLSVDKSGNIYIAGYTLRENRNPKAAPFTAKHEASGKLLWHKQLPKITMITGFTIAGSEAYVSRAVQGAGEMYLIKLGK